MNQQELIADQRELLDKGHALWIRRALILQGAFTPPPSPKKIILPVGVDKIADTIKIKWCNWSKAKEKWAVQSLAISLESDRPFKNEAAIDTMSIAAVK